MKELSEISLTDLWKEYNNTFRECGYYFKMSHLITNLRCHIGKLSSKNNNRRIGDGKDMD